MDNLHEWVSFRDNEGDLWMLDATFLTSNWSCIFGNGCSGILATPTPELEQGCCSHGAHFSDDHDHDRVLAHASRLTAEDWQFIDAPQVIATDADGDRLTAQTDHGCVFLNTPDFAGGSGCALHRAALRHGERPLDWKPDVCWQLPLRLESHVDENGVTVMMLREWTRTDWGDGGKEFHWWCTEDHQAFVDVHPVFETLRDEIVELIGEDVYQAFVDHVAGRGVTTFLGHPAAQIVRNDESG